QAAYKQLIVSHLRAGELAHLGIGRNLGYVFLRHELPLEALGLAAGVLALIRRDRTVVIPLAWAVVSMIAILGYEPIFPHHLVLLTPSWRSLRRSGSRPRRGSA